MNTNKITSNMVNKTPAQFLADFKVDPRLKAPILVTFYHIGTLKVIRGEYRGMAFACGMDFVQIVWYDPGMNCTVATSIPFHNVLDME